MSQHECSVCNNKFEEQYFDTEQNKCILHCKKNEDNDWYTQVNSIKEWNEVKVNNFWKCIQDRLDLLYDCQHYDYDIRHEVYVQERVIFPKFQQDIPYNIHACNREEMGTNFETYFIGPSEPGGHDEQINNNIFNKSNIIFSNCTFLDMANFKKYRWERPIEFEDCKFTNGILLPEKYLESIVFSQCNFYNSDIDLSYAIFDNNLEIHDCENINNLHLEESTFEKKVKIQFCYINGEANLYNTKFKDLADFYRTEFNEVVFTRTDFNNITIFSETEFNKDVDFKYTKFLEQSIFRDTVFLGKLNLRNTIFEKTPTFLDITSEKNPERDKLIEDRESTKIVKDIQVENRETARIIKSSLDSSHNIIEANKFYALEMKEREKELNDFKKPFEWLVFKVHGLSSNHSQDWILALLWIINFLLIYSFIDVFGESNYDPIAIAVITIGTLSSMLWPQIRKGILFIMAGVLLYHGNITLQSIADKVKEIFKFGEEFNFSTLSLKIVIAYLVYQFIVSVRQNTRRK